MWALISPAQEQQTFKEIIITHSIYKYNNMEDLDQIGG